MNKIYLLPKEGKFYKANLHNHTTVSDGAFTPEKIKEEYMKAGYSVVAYSDHNVFVSQSHLTDKGFLALDSFEFTIYEPVTSNFNFVKALHINFIDTDPSYEPEKKKVAITPLPAYGDFPAINSYIAKLNELGFISFYNHPYWSLENYNDFKDLEGLWGFEIYNHGCEVVCLNGYARQSYDELLRRGKGNLFCVMTDDNHNHSPIESPYWDSFGGFTMIKSESLDYLSISKALKRGDFYCSMGPEFTSLYIDSDKMLHIECSPVSAIFLTTAHRKTICKLASNGSSVSFADFKLDGDEGYFRITIKTNDGKYAESNAFFLSDYPEIFSK